MENSMGIYFFKAKLFDAFLLELQTSGTLVNYDVNKIVVEYGGKSQDIETNKEEQYQWKHPE